MTTLATFVMLLGCQGSLCAPAQLDSPAQFGVGHTNLLRPVGQGLSSSVVFNPVRAPLVAGLRCLHRPATVIGAVRAIIVLAVDRMPRRWPLAHVFQEGVKRQFPFVAHNDSSAAVMRVVGEIGVVAPLAHSVPRSALVQVSAPATSILAAPTRFGVATGEGVGWDNRQGTAFTQTFPQHVAAIGARWLHRSQAPKRLAGNISRLSWKRPASNGSGLSLKAATRTDVPVLQLAGPSEFIASTNAAAFPDCAGIDRVERCHCQASENLPSQVLKVVCSHRSSIVYGARRSIPNIGVPFNGGA